ncbi:hypothetical protein [Leptolyngbya sp. FACHB-711]|uniref:hypothetical protein n=2 Tax=Leptolyngbya TaxID=47251 RepID=UPI0019BC2814|nr:hypothetical protein [Leptolyngbya sp. FACHB-711]MBD2026745.1 hypothetical protein [Leptolyngbya sp. FACHB-711]
MHILKRVFAVVVMANVLHIAGISVGIALPAASAAAFSENGEIQKSVNGSIDLQEKSLSNDSFSSNLFANDNSPAAPKQVYKASIKLSQYSDNPTMPGEGTPDRTQGSGAR